MIAAADEQQALMQAARLDAAGRHGEAIDVLSAAAKRGGARARGIVGARILVGDRAPLLGAPGADLLAEAAEAGDAEAARIVSVLAAAGAYRKQDWTAALDYLALAAGRGAPEAQGALRALAGDAARERPADWRGLRDAVNLAALLRAPAARTLSEDPQIRTYAGFVPPALAAWLIERARPRLGRAAIYNATRARNEEGEARTNSQAGFTLLEADTAQIVLQARMADAAGVALACLESPAILHYAPGQRFAEHFDFIDPRTPGHDEDIRRNGQRAITVLAYLNDDYEGGRTDFARLGLSHRGAAGEALLFVNADAAGKGDVRTVHAGRPTGAGEKWIVSQFIRSRPVLPGAA